MKIYSKKVNLRWTLIISSDSPKEFFATHLYIPKSVDLTGMITNFIETW